MKKTLICILVVTVLLGFATLDKSQAASDSLHVLLTPQVTLTATVLLMLLFH